MSSMSIFIAAIILIVFFEEASIIIAANQEIINVNLHCLLPLYWELILVRQCNFSYKVWDWKTTLKVTKMLHQLNITFSREGANRASLETLNETPNTAFSFCVFFCQLGVISSSSTTFKECIVHSSPGMQALLYIQLVTFWTREHFGVWMLTPSRGREPKLNRNSCIAFCGQRFDKSSQMTTFYQNSKQTEQILET